MMPPELLKLMSESYKVSQKVLFQVVKLARAALRNKEALEAKNVLKQDH